MSVVGMVAGSVEKAESSDLKNLFYTLNSKPRLEEEMVIKTNIARKKELTVCTESPTYFVTRELI